MPASLIEREPNRQRRVADHDPLVARSLYQPRLSTGELARAYHGIPEAYAAGDYAFVARFGASEPELQAAALILIGSPLRGLDLLHRHGASSPHARLMEAFAAWYLGRETEARARLDDLLADRPGISPARALRNQLTRPQLEVLVATSRPSLAKGLREVPDFRVRTVGLPGQGCDLELDADLRLASSAAGRDALASADFLLLFDLGVAVPSDLALRPIPKFAYVPDIEMHLANDAAILSSMDALVAPCSQVAAELRALFTCPVYSLPIFGAPSATHDAGPASEESSPEKMIDILFTGSIATPLYVEKPGRFLELSQLPGAYDIRLLDKTFPAEDFKRLLASARFTPISLRFDGGISTRAIEALRLGTFALCLSPTDHDLYLDGAGEGIFQAEGADRLETIETYLRDYELLARHFAARRQGLRSKLAALFPHSPGVEQRWLKLLAFLALGISEPKPGPERINTALTWFNARLFGDKRTAGSVLLAAPTEADHTIKQLVTEASLALDAGDFARTLRLAKKAAPPADAVIQKLNPGLLAGLLFLKAGERYAAEALLARIWHARAEIAGNPSDGLIYFDFWLSNDLRRDFVSEALYGDAVVLEALGRTNAPGRRTASDPTRLLLSGIGTWLSARHADAGKHRDAAAFAEEALRLAPENFAAMYRLGRARLADPTPLVDAVVRDDALDLLSRAVWLWPWYLVEILPLLRMHSNLDGAFLGGQAHAVYLRFVQRVRTDRRGVADFQLARPVRAYLRAKLGLEARTTASPQAWADRLAVAGLRLSEPDFFLENIVLPLFWDAAEELAASNGEAAAGLFALAEAASAQAAARLRSESSA